MARANNNKYYLNVMCLFSAEENSNITFRVSHSEYVEQANLEMAGKWEEEEHEDWQ